MLSLAICMLAFTLAARLVVASRDGANALDIALLLAIAFGAPAFTIAVTLIFCIMRTERRTAALRSANPDAFIAQIVANPSAVRPLDLNANKVQGHSTRVGPSSYLTVVVDKDTIRIFGGSRKPRELASFPTRTLLRAELGTEQSGVRVVPCIDLHLEDGSHSARVSILLISFIHGVPRFVRDAALDAALDDLRRATLSELAK